MNLLRGTAFALLLLSANARVNWDSIVDVMYMMVLVFLCMWAFVVAVFLVLRLRSAAVTGHKS